MAHMVTCTKCGKRFDRDKYKYIEVGARRYAHENCDLIELNQTAQDKNALLEYIKQIYGSKEVSVKILKQIQTYTTDYNYTYSGIHKSLIYWFEIRKNSIEKSKGTIGIVPYIYDEAKEYFFSIFQAQEKNKTQNEITSKFYESKTITIPPPERNCKPPKFFSV